MSDQHHQVLAHLSDELSYQPELIGHRPDVGSDRPLLMAGMGGSGLPIMLLQQLRPELPIRLHQGYGLPATVEQGSLCIAISHSGNTEEALSFAQAAIDAGHELAVISMGGKLIELAADNDVAYIQIPDDGVQPRYAVGYLLMALAELLSLDKMQQKLASLQPELQPVTEVEASAKQLADQLNGKLPVVYAPARWSALAYIWKVKFNETSKIPAFSNQFPELNHNEFTGFDRSRRTTGLSDNIAFLVLDDGHDEHMTTRINATVDILRDKGLTVLTPRLVGQDQLSVAFNQIALADWTTLLLAEGYGVEPFEIPMVEDLKQRLAADG